ncbi:MAG: DUF4136 domain-containing protein [Chitinophagaceae bacterium]|nr:DUF4136 domain-containing protein [Chitinophagaceae bacterium]
MKTISQFFRILLPAALFGGCSAAVHVQQDAGTNLDNYHTYSWVDTRSSENDNSVRAAAYADIAVRNAANAALQRAGWREVSNSNNADVLVSYDVLVQRSRERRSDPVYSQPFSRMYYNPYRRSWSTIYYPSQFVGYQNYSVPVKEGTITISMTDANTDKLIWQGWTTENVNYTNLTDGQIDRSVRNIFKKFRP